MAEDHSRSRLLILCLDRDDDVGGKTQVKTPVVGRENCISLASKLALADPEEADANAIFASVKLYDELVAKGHRCEVAVVCGLQDRGVEGDQKIARETRRVAQAFGADGVVVVTDGAEDELAIPVLQGVVPVVSVRRVVIKHSRSVEESYAILGRYLRMVVYDPRYSKFILGVPGILLVMFGVLSYFNLTEQAAAIAAAIIGIALIGRGFDLDKAVSSLTRMSPSGYLRAFSIFAGLLVIVAAVQQGFAAIGGTEQYGLVVADPSAIVEYGAFLAGGFLRNALNYLWIALAIIFGGALLVHWFQDNPKVLRDALGLVMISLLYLPMLQFSLILMGETSPLSLISLVLIGLAVTFFVVIIVYEYYRSRRVLEET